jgi:hypothetical protein
VKVCGFDGHKSGDTQICFLHWKPVSVQQKKHRFVPSNITQHFAVQMWLLDEKEKKTTVCANMGTIVFIIVKYYNTFDNKPCQQKGNISVVLELPR